MNPATTPKLSMNKWISVIDKLPETPDPVLAVAVPYGEHEPRVYAMCHRYSRWSDDDEWTGGWHCAQGDGYDIPVTQVTHWMSMPMPPPPEPQDDEVSRLIREGKELSRSVFCPRLVCNDGFTMSVQASHGHYCSDRDSSATHWSSVEVGFPSEREELLLPYREGFLDGEATKMVYPYTPCDVVAQVIAKHGGFKSYAVGTQHIGTYADPDQWIEDLSRSYMV